MYLKLVLLEKCIYTLKKIEIGFNKGYTYTLYTYCGYFVKKIVVRNWILNYIRCQTNN